jgi:hypothetical protein
MGDDVDKPFVLLLEFREQVDLVLGHELQSIGVIAELIELTQRARQSRIVGGEERRRNAIELARRVMLDLPVRFDLALQMDQLLGALIDTLQNLQAHCARHDEQGCNCEECCQQLGLHAGRNPRNQVDQPSGQRHHGSCSRLTRSRRNSSGSKRTPTYWTRRIPR